MACRSRAIVRRPAAFLDRDGVLNVDHGYTHKPEQLEWIEGAAEAVRLLNEAGYYVLVITNQSGVSAGYLSMKQRCSHSTLVCGTALPGMAPVSTPSITVHIIPRGLSNSWQCSAAAENPARACSEQAAREWPIDTGASFLIGDKDDDLAAAAAFKIRGIKFNSQINSLPDLVRRELANCPNSQDRRPS